jgi:hypothetical protein
MRSLILYSLITAIVSLSITIIAYYTVSVQNRYPSTPEAVITGGKAPDTTTRTVLPRTHFLTYENPAYGIKIQYPSYWERVDLSRNFIVSFIPPSENDTGLLENLVVGVSRLPSSFVSLNDFAATRINLYRSQFTDFHLIDTSQSTTTSGNPIYKIEYTHNNGRLAIETMEVWTMKGTTAFMILYNADTPEYPYLVPIIQKMVDSFSTLSPPPRLHNV